jgi:hypothetical protein
VLFTRKNVSLPPGHMEIRRRPRRTARARRAAGVADSDGIFRIHGSSPPRASVA